MEEGDGEEEGGVESLLKWGCEVGVSDSFPPKTAAQPRTVSCLGHTLSVSDFPEAGGYVDAVLVFICFQLLGHDRFLGSP